MAGLTIGDQVRRAWKGVPIKNSCEGVEAQIRVVVRGRGHGFQDSGSRKAYVARESLAEGRAISLTRAPDPTGLCCPR